jgi:hypothetical protein
MSNVEVSHARIRILHNSKFDIRYSHFRCPPLREDSRYRLLCGRSVHYRAGVQDPCNMRRSRAILILIGFLSFHDAARSEQAKRPHFLHAMVFESYLTQPPENRKFYDAIELPSNDFPLKFTRLFAKTSSSEKIQLPLGVVFPKAPMFLDICTFAVSNEQVMKKKSFSRYNGINQITYKMKFLSWANGRYRIRISGRHEELNFKNILLEAPADKTEIVRIKRSESRVLYIALTPIEIPDAGSFNVIPPKPASQIIPVYPSELMESKWSGTIRILAAITSEGKPDGQLMILLDCPHYLLGRRGLETLLNEWTFSPATRDGQPIDFETVVGVNFYFNAVQKPPPFR